jgi:GNAT superfamily N-acetyltransferase
MSISKSEKNKGFSCRKAEQRDIEALTELLCELYENHEYEELLAENKTHFSNGKQAFFLAYDGDKAIGVCHGALRNEYINGKTYDGTVGYLEAIYVRPEYRLLGVATHLISLCEEWAQHSGCREFMSDCLLENTDSYRFHKRIGFTETERCIFFRKELKPINRGFKTTKLKSVYDKARTFLYRHARPLDIARWQYHFEGGSKDDVLTALAAYQNRDGGFGHALEPDAWNPNSAPIQTWTATEILREIDFTDSTHPLIQGILRYLANGEYFNGNFWYNVINSNNDYPHAPWWHAELGSTYHDDYNPTACLAGFIIRFADKDSELYQLGCRIAKEACESYFAGDLLDNMHTVTCYVRLWHRHGNRLYRTNCGQAHR